MTRPDWESWEAQEPPRGFAEGVLAAAQGDASKRAPGRARTVMAGLLLAASVAAAVGFGAHLRGAGAHGDATAAAREEVHVGRRAVAVLEKGARVSWDGDRVQQESGDVFWRVEPGERFVVRTPAGDVTVKGTCFRVKVLPLGAAAAAALAVAVYEGKVGVSHAGVQVDLVAGESVTLDDRGAHRSAAPEGDPEAPKAAPKDEAARAVAKLDRARADRMREAIRAVFAEAGPADVAPAPSARPVEAPAPAPAPRTMPVIPDPEGGTKVDPSYIQQRIRNDLFPLARGCYEGALEKNPRMAGKLAVYFRILGDKKIGGVVDDVKILGESTIDDSEMRTCVRESMMSITFDAPPDDGEITVVYPIVFSPDEPDAGDGG